jgi:hypothetical protein
MRISTSLPLPLTKILLSSITPPNDIAPINDIFLPLFCGFSPLGLSPFKALAYNLSNAKLTPDSSKNIKFFSSLLLLSFENKDQLLLVVNKK